MSKAEIRNDRLDFIFDMFTTTGGSEEEDEVLPLVTDDEEESSEEDAEDLGSVDGVKDYEDSDKDLGDLDERVWKRARKIPLMRKMMQDRMLRNNKS